MAAAATARKLNKIVINASSKACDPPNLLTMSRIMPLTERFADGVHHAAEERGVEPQPDRPREQGAPLQPPRQPEGAVQHGAAAGAPGARKSSPTDIAAAQQHVRGERQHHRGHQVEQQHPPPLSRVRAYFKGPAQRRKPRQDAGAGVTHRA